MLREQKPPNITTLQVKRLSPGRKMDHWSLKQCQVDSEDIESMMDNNPMSKKKKRICYCRVSSNGQRDDLNRQIEYMREHYPGWTIMSDIGSGLNWNRKTLEPFYNGQCEEMSRQLRSLIETDWPDSDSKLSNSCWHKTELGSSAIRTTIINPKKKSSSKISFQLSPSSVRKYMADGTTKAEKQTRIRTIQVFPTLEQTQVLKKWFGNCRYTYNTCVAHERNNGIKTKKVIFNG